MPTKHHWRITVGIPGSLQGPLMAAAERNGKSPASFIVDALRGVLGGRAAIPSALVRSLGSDSWFERPTPIQDNIDANGGAYVGDEKMRFPRYKKP